MRSAFLRWAWSPVPLSLGYKEQLSVRKRRSVRLPFLIRVETTCVGSPGGDPRPGLRVADLKREVNMSIFDRSELFLNMTRRELVRNLGALGALGMIEPRLLTELFTDRRHISRLAAQPPSREGTWEAQRIQGRVPKDLNGTLYRVAKGQLQNHGVTLKHWFDGDAFVIKYSILEGRVQITARFVETPERQQETAAGRMLYHEFGTAVPDRPAYFKNQPNINVILWDGRLLGLSEAFHPSAIDPGTLAYQGRWDFYGTLPPNVTFTAHPKFDPADGVGYTFGTNNGVDWAVMIYRMELNGTLTHIAKLPEPGPGWPMAHDMLLGREHLVFVIPPLQYDVYALMSGRVSAADVLQYMETNPTRVIVVRKDGSGDPIVFEQPPGTVYHHGNLTETGNLLSFHSLMSPGDSEARLVASWSEDNFPRLRTELTQLSLDLSGEHQVTRTVLAKGIEFPRFDTRRIGAEARYLYTLRSDHFDSLSFPEFVRHDLLTGREQRVRSGRNRTLEEVVFVPRPGKTEETEGWLLGQGYDAALDQTFLEIRDAETLELEARVWTLFV
jgi:all-trans-8'-apo-beta-carotenal 15,15'-oxygenase